MPKLTGSLVKYPARISFAWYIGLITLGAIILAQPICHGEGEPLSWLDAFFTSTSASCVTGLAVRSTELDFSIIGQVVLLGMIQLGGIGIMTVTTFVMFHIGSAESLRDRMVLSETLGADSKSDLRTVLRNVMMLAFLFEGIGFVLLSVREFIVDGFGSIGGTLWRSLFHSVSAFCNAGFSLHDDSLTGYQADWSANLIIGALVIVGGIGFPVILDIRGNWKGPWKDRWRGLHLHSKLMLIGISSLLLLGTAAFLALEWNGALANKPAHERVLIAGFHSMSCRTAGFTTTDLRQFSNASIFVSILLMAIGAGPCSTGGGLKVSTFCVLVMEAWTTFRGSSRIQLFRRAIPRMSVERAIAALILFSVVAVLSLTLLLVVEQNGGSQANGNASFIGAAFEVVSALGTVGLTIGMTPELSQSGRLIIIGLMFIGRLGPITMFVALSGSQRKEAIEYPHEEPLTG